MPALVCCVAAELGRDGDDQVHGHEATPVFSDATPSRAYIVLAMHLSMNVKRKAASQSGRWALVMRKSGSAWQVTSAAWAQNAGG